MILYTETVNHKEEKMATSMIAFQGQTSPEYRAIIKMCGSIVSVLELPTNEISASWGLLQVRMINPSHGASGEEMVQSILKCVSFDARDFYKFLFVLQDLSNTVEILKTLHREFLCKEIHSRYY